MSENFKLNESLLNGENIFRRTDFYRKDNNSISNKEYQEFVIKFYVEKMITNDYGYDEALELYFEGKIVLNYDKNNVFDSYNIVIYDEFRFTDIDNPDNEGVVDLYDDYFSLDDIGLTETDAIFEIDTATEEIEEFLSKNAKNLIIFDKQERNEQKR